MRSTKRVILASGSRLLREMLQRVINRADHLEVVQEVPNPEELPSAIKRFDPKWVIVSLPDANPLHPWIESCMIDHPSVRFIFLSPIQNHVKMKWQTTLEEDYSDLSLKDFINILEKDLQRT